MKKIHCNKIILIGILIAFLVSSYIHAINGLSTTINRVTITFKKPNDMAQSLLIKADTNVFHSSFELFRDENGKINISKPLFASFNFNDVVIIGQIDTKSLLSLMLDPFNTSIQDGGFKKNSNISISNNVKPKLSGIAICTNHFDLISFSSIFNQASPNGFGFIFGNNKIFLGLLYASQNNILESKTSTIFQTNWKNAGFGKHTLFSLIGTSFSIDYSLLEIKGSLFVQNAWDLYHGGGTTTGISITVKSQKMILELDRYLGGVGINLKQLSNNENPFEKIHFSFATKNALSASKDYIIKCTYDSSTFRPPLYGGFSQERKIEYKVAFITKNFNIQSANTTHYETDKGKTSKTVIKTTYNYKTTTLGLSTTIDRKRDSKYSIVDTTFSLSCKKASLVFKGKKAKLGYTVEFMIHEASTAKFVIDQDRNIEISISIKDVLYMAQ